MYSDFCNKLDAFLTSLEGAIYRMQSAPIDEVETFELRTSLRCRRDQEEEINLAVMSRFGGAPDMTVMFAVDVIYVYMEGDWQRGYVLDESGDWMELRTRRDVRVAIEYSVTEDELIVRTVCVSNAYVGVDDWAWIAPISCSGYACWSKYQISDVNTVAIINKAAHGSQLTADEERILGDARDVCESNRAEKWWMKLGFSSESDFWQYPLRYR